MNKLSPEAQARCKHKQIKLGYLEWHEMASKRKDKQKQCTICKLWLFKEEMRDD